MNDRSLLWRLIAIVLGALAASCAGIQPLPGRIPDALSSFVVWSEVGVAPEVGARGEVLDVISVRGGDVMRLELWSDAPLLVGERFPSGQSRSESWLERSPSQGVLLLRMSAFASALMLPRGAIVRAYRGHGSDPGYHWFDLEDRVLAWATGPLPAPFPALAPPERLDFAGFRALDRVLEAALAAAQNPRAALDQAQAVRAVAGLRAVRALRPATGLPYFLDSALPVSATRGRYPSYPIKSDRALEMPVSGPGILHIWIKAQPKVGHSAELRVFEGDRLRAETRLPLASAPKPQLAPQAEGGLASARHALVQVPPGRHHYRLESTAELSATLLFAEPIVHLEQAGQKSETVQLARARRACEPGGSVEICALSLALLGLDGATERADGRATDWGAVFGSISDSARRVALDLAAGGPHSVLERFEANADPARRATLDQSLVHSVDEATRRAAVQALAQNSEWQVLMPESDLASPWLSVAGEHSESPQCTNDGLAALGAVTASTAQFQTTRWYGVPVVEFLVRSDCDDQRPVELEVDGERLTARPSAGWLRWRVRVRGDHAQVRRLDASRAQVSALPVSEGECRQHLEALRAPEVAARGPVLHPNARPGTAGLELWLREGSARAELTVTEDSRGPRAARSARLSAPRTSGFAAYDAHGVPWTRVARLALPPWASGSLRVAGAADVAVRALRRVSRPAGDADSASDEAASAAVPVDEAALVDLTRELLARTPDQRGPLYLRRALALAAGGAERAALADARAAQALGAIDPGQEVPLRLVQAQLRRVPIAPEPLPSGVNAYGVEQDFAADAEKCQLASDGAHAELARQLADSSSPPHHPGEASTFDVEAAVHAFALRERLPLDPRSDRLTARALRGSRWRLRQELGGPSRRVRRPSVAKREGAVDGEGELRPRIAVGARFAGGTYATVLPGRPALAVLSGTPRAAGVRVEVACAAREPALAQARCPLTLSVDGQPLQIEFARDGQATVALPELGDHPQRLLGVLEEGPGNWAALVRLVTSRRPPNGVPLDEQHWAIAPQASEIRSLIKPGAPVLLETHEAELLRVDARAEGALPAELVVVIGGRERVVPANGEPSVLPVSRGDTVSLQARGSALTIAVAERVPSDRASNPDEPDESSAAASRAEPSQPTNPGPITFDAESAAETSGWLELARRSPAPLSPVQASLGTLVAEAGAVSGKLHETTPSAWRDAYLFNLIGYRRRIESLGLWTRAEVFSRTRPDTPTVGALGSLYEDLSQAHVRLTATLKLERQTVAGLRAKSVLCRGFVEYSYRATPEFFVLPRLGYDGMYSTVPRQPTSLAFVDDEIYSPYRARRPTFLFLQSLLWYAPYFNEILYSRLRATFDAKAQALSHSALVVGAFLAFHNLDLSGQAQTTWYIPRDSPTGRAHLDATTGIAARYSLWSGLGSLAVTPGLAAALRPQDAGWQITVFLNLAASFRRGLRDFSSLELDFPEQLSGGIPWRGATPGAYQ